MHSKSRSRSLNSSRMISILFLIDRILRVAALMSCVYDEVPISGVCTVIMVSETLVLGWIRRGWSQVGGVDEV